MNDEEREDILSEVSADIPTDQKADLIEIAHDRSTPYETVRVGDVVAEAIAEYLADRDEEVEKA